jgi:hypothetical protein
VEQNTHAVTDWFRAQPEHVARLGAVIRQALDEVLDGQRTGRFDPSLLNDIERQYVSVKLAILLEAEFELRPSLTLSYFVEGFVEGIDVSLAWSFSDSWIVEAGPAVGTVLLVSGDDSQSVFSVGVVQVPASSDGRKWVIRHTQADPRIEWLAQDASLAENLLLHLPETSRHRIFAQASGQHVSTSCFGLRRNELYREKRCSRWRSRRMAQSVCETREKLSPPKAS